LSLSKICTSRTDFLSAMTPNRKAAKSTPSPKSLRERVLRNCLSEIRTKRNSLVQQYRVQPEECKNEIMKSFVNNVYRATKREDEQVYLSNENTMEQDQTEEEYLQSFGHQEFLRQIADAVAFELEKHEYFSEEDEFLEIAEAEDMSRVELYDPDDNTIICPLCRFVLQCIHNDILNQLLPVSVVLQSIFYNYTTEMVLCMSRKTLVLHRVPVVH